MRAEDRIYNWLGQYDGFYTRPPLDHRKIYVNDRVISLNNDGSETWIGSPDQWYVFFKNSDFRKIAFWSLRQWAFVDWFGLRSWLWYKLLHRKVNRAKPTAPKEVK